MTPEEKAAHDALLLEVRTAASTEIDKRGFQDAANVKAVVEESLKGLNLEQLRAYDADKIDKTLKSLAGEVEKVKNIRMGSDLDAHRGALKQAVDMLMGDKEDGTPGELEMLMRSKGNGSTKEIVLNIRAAATMTTDNTINENSYPDEMIESVSLIDGVVKKRRGEQYIFDIADRRVVAEIEQYTSWLEEGTEEGAFAIVAEGAVKPLVSTSLVRNYAEAKKIAGKTVITEEFAKWRKKAWAAIQDLLRDKLQRDYAAILTTDLNAQAASYVGTSLDDTIVTPTDFDAIGAVAAQIETLNFHPDVLILHPQDKWRLILQKDSENRYYMLVPFVDADGVVRMMGFRVVTSTYQTQGTFTLGESGLFKIEEETITIRLGYGIDVTVATIGTSGAQGVTAVTSDFDNNRMRMIIETYFKDWIATNHIGSFVRATFAAVKAALLKP
jgi:hypothetical protein